MMRGAGVYFVTLTVSNDDGDIEEASGTVTVTECIGEPCTDFVQGEFPLGGPFTDLNPIPCGDACGTPLVSNFEVYINEGYLFPDLIAGNSYNANICSGPNAGSWNPVLTLAYYDEATTTVGEVVTFAVGCSLDFSAPEDGTYILVITEEGNCDGAPPTQIDNGNLEISCTGDNPCVVGDFCESAIPIDISLGAVNGPFTNTDASTSATDPDAGDCFFGSDPYQATVWFTFEGDGSTVFIYTDASCPGIDNAHPDTQMGIYQDDCADPAFVACDDDGGLNPLMSGWELDTEAGVTYYIVIDGWQGQGGDFCINIGEPLECAIGTTDALPEQTVNGDGTAANPYVVCPDNTIGLTSSGDFVVDASLAYPNPGVAWLVYNDQPSATNPLGDINNTGGILSNANGDVIFDNGSTNLTDIGLTPGTYILVPVIITDTTAPLGVASFGGCTGIDLDVTYPYFTLVEEADCPATGGPTPEISGATELCEGETTTLATGIYAVYEWSNGETTQVITITPSVDTQYCVTVTDDTGATGSDCVTVTINPNPAPSIVGPTSTCSGIQFTLDAGGGFDQYLWDDGSTSQVMADAPMTDSQYCVTVTDAAGCTGEDCHDVTIDPNVIFEITGPASTCLGSDVVLDAGAYDIYFWDDGSTMQTITDAPMTDTQYCVTVTDASGCTGSACLQVTIAPDPVPVITGSLTFPVGGSTVLDAGGGYNLYLWNEASASSTQTITVTTAGQYCATVTDANGCTGSACADVTEAEGLVPVITGNLEICEGATTTLDAGEYAAYEWSNGETTQIIEVSNGGEYCVTVTDDVGATGSGCVVVTINPLPIVNIEGPTDFCEGDVVTICGPLMAEGCVWNTGEIGNCIQVFSSGTYCVTVTDENGCTDEDCLDVIAHSLPTPIITGALTFPPGGSTTLNAGGGFIDYLWNEGSTTQTINIDQEGEYCVTVTTTNGCIDFACVSVTEVGGGPVPNIAGNLEICEDATTVLDAGEYAAYEWSNGEATQTIEAQEGQYCVTVTDDVGATGTACVDVVVAPPPTPDLGADIVVCEGETATLDAGGGFDSYLWTTGETTQSITASNPGDHCVTVTNAVGCSGSACVNFAFSDLFASVQIICDVDGNGANTGTAALQVDISGGAPDYVIEGADGSFDHGHSYTVVVTDAEGCQFEMNGVVDCPVPVNNPPVADNDDFGFTVSGGSLTLEVITNDSDPDGDVLTITNVTQPAEGGSVSIDGNNLILEVDANFVGDIVFTYEISDGTASDEATVTVSILPDCNSSAGTMPADEVVVCAGQASNISGNDDAIVADDDVTAYVLHDAAGAALGNVIATNASAGEFANDGNGDIAYNTTYYVSLVVGPTDEDGKLMLDHPCTFVAAGTPVVFLAPVGITADDDCDNETGEFTVTFSVSGGLPGYDGTAQYTVSGDFSGSIFAGESNAIGPFVGGTSFALNASDGLCGSAEVVEENVECLKTPIELISFTGEVFEEGNFLKWITATEIDNDFFTLERSTDGTHFEEIASVDAAGTSFTQQSYDWMDADAKPGLNYYRLWQTDYDGETVEVGLITLVRGELNFEITALKPVPVRDVLQLTYTSESVRNVIVGVYDLAGKKVLDANRFAERGINTLNIDVSTFASGVYFLSLTDGANVQTRKWVKE